MIKVILFVIYLTINNSYKVIPPFNFGSAKELQRNSGGWSIDTIIGKSNRLMYCFPSDEGESISAQYKKQILNIMKSSAFFISYTFNKGKANSLSEPLIDEKFKLAPTNLPSDDFWYPPFMIGTWNTTFIFRGAKFSKKFSLNDLKTEGSVPGFKKYSVGFIPQMGYDAKNISMRFVQIDSHPREDHTYNLRSLMSAFSQDTIIDDVAYNYRKAPTWFSSPANHWSMKYHDRDGSGEIEFSTRKRNIEVFAGTVKTIEFIQQTHIRNNLKMVGDYALNWRISTPSSFKDEFVNVESLSQASSLLGTLDVLVYLPITSPLYIHLPAQPVGVYSYDVTMDRMNSLQSDTKETVYPFVPRDVGPTELKTYFGY